MALIKSLAVLTVACCLAGVAAAPNNRRSPMNPMCRKTKFKQVFSIENDVYLAAKSSSIFQYSAENQTFAEAQSSFETLFGKEFIFVDSVVSLAGFCDKSPLCTDSSWKEIENLTIVIGTRMNPRNYGFALYEINKDGERPFKLLTTKTATKNMLEKIDKLKIGIQGEKAEEDSIIMQKEFWFKESRTFTVSGSVFVPSQAEMLMLVAVENADKDVYLYRRKFTTTQPEAWTSSLITDLGLERAVKLTGLVRIDQDIFAVDEDSKLYDIEWRNNDVLAMFPSKKKYKLTNCSESVTSTPSTTTPTTMPTTASASSSAPVAPKKAEVASEVEMIPGSTVGVIKGDSAEIIEEPTSNRVDDADPHQNDDPNSHSTPATGQSTPQHSIASTAADGLGWTVAIVVMVLLLLTIFILIPIIYVRNKGAKSMKVTTNGKTGSSPGSQKEENRALMSKSSTQSDV